MKSGTVQQPAAVASQQQGQQNEVKTIFSYKKELGLTDKQEKNLRDILANFQNYLVDKRNEISTLNAELADMIKKRDSLRAIRAKIDNIARIRADASYSDVETSRKVEGVLTSAQLMKWKEIQEEAQKSAQRDKK